jgi:hypothetical protein
MANLYDACPFADIRGNERSLPIRYAKDIVVDQVTVDLMSKAFSDALNRLRLSRALPLDEPEWVRETLALRRRGAQNTIGGAPSA